MKSYSYFSRNSKKPELPPKNDKKCPILFFEDLKKLSDDHIDMIIQSRVPINVRSLKNNYTAIDLRQRLPGEKQFIEIDHFDLVFILPFTKNNYIGYNLEYRVARHIVLLNLNHKFVKWIVSVKPLCEECLYGLEMRQFNHMLKLFIDLIKYSNLKRNEMLEYLDGWRKISGLPTEFHPPILENLENIGDFVATKSSMTN
jgi:hypothetical protein